MVKRNITFTDRPEKPTLTSALCYRVFSNRFLDWNPKPDISTWLSAMYSGNRCASYWPVVVSTVVSNGQLWSRVQGISDSRCWVLCWWCCWWWWRQTFPHCDVTHVRLHTQTGRQTLTRTHKHTRSSTGRRFYLSTFKNDLTPIENFIILLIT